MMRPPRPNELMVISDIPSTNSAPTTTSGEKSNGGSHWSSTTKNDNSTESSNTYRPSHFYRPVFNAEEKLIQAIRASKMKRENMSEVSNYVSTVSTVEWNTGNDYPEVVNLPDHLPPIPDRKSSRLDLFLEKRANKHYQNVQEMSEKIEIESRKRMNKLEEIVKEMKEKLDESQSRAESIMNELKDKTKLRSFTKAKVDSDWSDLKVFHFKNIEAIELYCKKVEEVESNSISFLRNELSEYYKLATANAHLPEEDNCRWIENQALLINQSLLSNARYLCKFFNVLTEHEVSFALNLRTEFNGCKSDWARAKVLERIAKFNDWLRSELIVSPPAATSILDELKQKRTSEVGKRKAMIDEMNLRLPTQTNSAEVGQWMENMKGTQDRIMSYILEAKEKCTAVYQSVKSEMDIAVRNLEHDLKEFCDSDEVGGYMKPIFVEIELQCAKYDKKLVEVVKEYEKKSGKSNRKVSACRKAVAEAVMIWEQHCEIINSHKTELKTDLENLEYVYKREVRDLESMLSNQVEELRQESDDGSIERLEKGIVKTLRLIKAEYDHFHQKHSNVLRAFRRNCFKDQALVEVRHVMLTGFPNKYNRHLAALDRELESDLVEKSKVVSHDLVKKYRDHETRLDSIRENTVEIRKRELKMHFQRYKRHENEVNRQLRLMTKNIRICEEQSDEIIEQADEVFQYFMPRFGHMKKVAEMEKLPDEISRAYEMITDALNTSVDSFMHQNEMKMGEIKHANGLCISQMKLFKNGGNFATKEVEKFKNKMKILENKIMKMYITQNRLIQEQLPSGLQKVDTSKKILLETFQQHMMDVTLINKIDCIALSSQVLIKSEIARIQQIVADLEKDCSQLGHEFDNYWSSKESENTERLTANQLHHRLDTFKNKLNATMEEMRRQKCAKKWLTALTQGENVEFYEKWLLGRKANDDTEEAPDPKALSGRSRIFSTIMSNRALSKMRTSKFGEADRRMSTRLGGKMMESEESGMRKRIIRDAKTEVKVALFNMHKEPHPIDFPSRITRIMFFETDQMLVEAEGYYKNKGARAITRTERIPENFDKSCESIKQRITQQEENATIFTTKTFDILRRLLHRTEVLGSKLPEIMLKDFCDEFKTKIVTELKDIRKRHEILMETFAVAKNEHLESLRINLGHPEFTDQINGLAVKERERRNKHRSAVIQRGQCLKETFEDIMKNGLNKFCSLVANLLTHFDSFRLIEEVIIEGGIQIVKLGRKWPKIDDANLPSFTNDELESKKSTSAHQGLMKARDAYVVRMKKIYKSGLTDIKSEEENSLNELQRWSDFWTLQLQDITSCYTD